MSPPYPDPAACANNHRIPFFVSALYFFEISSCGSAAWNPCVHPGYVSTLTFTPAPASARAYTRASSRRTSNPQIWKYAGGRPACEGKRSGEKFGSCGSGLAISEEVGRVS